MRDRRPRRNPPSPSEVWAAESRRGQSRPEAVLRHGRTGQKIFLERRMEGKSVTDRPPMGVSGGTNVKGMEDLGNLPINFRGNLVSATTDMELSDLLSQAKSSKRPVVVNYGATWCHACRQMLPTFCNASNENPKTLFIYADIDKCEQETQDVRYTPIFRFYRDGDKVDEFYGAGPQRLRDRLWLHS